MRRAIRSELGPRFANRQQRDFYDSTTPELLYSGAFGAGKTRILCEKAYWLGLRYPGAAIGIFRKVAASLAATTRLTFMRDVLDPDQVARSNKTEGWIELRNGTRFWFMGLDPDTITGVPSKVGSLDLTFAFVDEAVEVTEADWTMLIGRLRKTDNVAWNGTPAWTQIAAATNPADPLHWLKVRFADHPRRQFIHARTFDNTLLPADYIARMDDVAPGIFRNRYVEGEWVSINGDIFRSSWFRRVGTPPPGGIRRAGVDLNASIKTHADFTAVVETLTDAEHNLYVVGAWRQRLDHGHREWLLNGPPHLDNQRTFAGIRIEAVAYQSAFAAEMLHSTNLPIQPVHPDKDKVNRAMALAARYQGGKVYHVAGAPGIEELEAELLGFPGGPHDDLVDALVYAADSSNTYAGSIVGSN
jgi:phage terminase large subunit-like protein